MENDAANSNCKPPQNSVTLKKVQGSMNSQSNGRSQRPKGKRVKVAFQIGSVLVVCLWMLYQAKQSHDTNYGGSVRNESGGTGIVGRKVNVGSSSLVGEGVKGEVRGGGIDVSDEEMVELKYKELNFADDNSEIEHSSLEEGDFEEGHGVQQATMYDQEGDKDMESTSRHKIGENEDEMSRMIAEQGHESDAHQDLGSENEVPNERKNDSLQNQNSMVDGGHGFDDETGVPLDGNDIIESRVTESDGDGEDSLHEQMYTRVKKLLLE